MNATWKTGYLFRQRNSRDSGLALRLAGGLLLAVVFVSLAVLVLGLGSVGAV